MSRSRVNKLQKNDIIWLQLINNGIKERKKYSISDELLFIEYIFDYLFMWVVFLLLFNTFIYQWQCSWCLCIVLLCAFVKKNQNTTGGLFVCLFLLPSIVDLSLPFVCICWRSRSRDVNLLFKSELRFFSLIGKKKNE